MRSNEKPVKAWVLRCDEIKNVGHRRLVHLYLSMLLDYDCTTRDLEEVVRRVQTSGSITFLTEVLPALGKHIEYCTELGSWTPFSGLKTSKDSYPYPVFLHGPIKEFFDTLDLEQEPSLDNISLLRMLRQICYFAYKAQPNDDVSSEIVAKSIEKYFELEDSLPVPARENGHHINWDPILLRANSLIRELFRDFTWDDLYSGHGPGSVKDLDYARKFDAVIEAPHESKARYQYFKTMDHFVEDCWRIAANDHNSFMGLGSASEVLFVPKDSRGPRTICREPAGNMIAQQGIMKYMVQKMESDPLTKGRVNFTDQTVNQTLARTSSLTREFATLDLSDASDRISVALFEHLFADTELGWAIMLTRSSRAEFPQRHVRKNIVCEGHNFVRLRKLAPMGSAVCFTTLAASVWALLYSALELSGREDLAVRVHVYGDDIIVPVECYAQCIMILENYYLKVNTGKSFGHGWFRESCGTDAYGGGTVTPVRLRYFPTPEYLTNPKNKLASFAATVHQLWAKGLFTCARELACMLPGLPPGDGSEPYITLPSELLGLTKREYWVNQKGCVVSCDSCGLPFVRGNAYRVVSDRADVSESTISYFHRALLPVIGRERVSGDTQPYGSVPIPRRTLVLRKKTRVYL